MSKKFRVRYLAGHHRLELVVPVTTKRGVSAILQIFGAEKNAVKPRID